MGIEPQRTQRDRERHRGTKKRLNFWKI